MGYDVPGRIKMHYCIPILSIERNGLRQVRSVSDTEFMLTFVSLGHLFLQVYLDHDESPRRMNWDDVVQFPVIELPEVIVSPLKPMHSEQEEEPTEHVPLSVVPPEPSSGTRTRRHSTRVQAMADQANEAEVANANSDDEDDSDYNESIILDSEYDITDGDDDLVDDEVSNGQDVKGKERKKQSTSDASINKRCKKEGKEEAEYKDDEISEDDELFEPDSNEEKVKLRCKTFTPKD
jgi:hypothetical protein